MWGDVCIPSLRCRSGTGYLQSPKGSAYGAFAPLQLLDAAGPVSAVCVPLGNGVCGALSHDGISLLLNAIVGY